MSLKLQTALNEQGLNVVYLLQTWNCRLLWTKRG